MNKLSENVEVTLDLNIQTLNNSAAASTWRSMRTYDVGLYRCISGAIAAGGALAWQVWQAQDGAGTNAKVIAGKTAAHTDAEDDTVKEIEVHGEELDASEQVGVAGGFCYIKVVATETGTQDAVVACELLREAARYKGATMPA